MRIDRQESVRQRLRRPPGSISKPISVPTKVVSSPSVVANLLKTRQFHPKRNRPKKRFSGFDTPSKCVSPNIIKGFVKSAAQKTGEVQLSFLLSRSISQGFENLVRSTIFLAEGVNQLAADVGPSRRKWLTPLGSVPASSARREAEEISFVGLDEKSFLKGKEAELRTFGKAVAKAPRIGVHYAARGKTLH